MFATKHGSIGRLLSITLASLLLTALAGCAAESEEEPAAEEPAEAATVDTFTYAQGADPRGLDPALVDDGESSKVIVNIYEGLLKYTESQTIATQRVLGFGASFGMSDEKWMGTLATALSAMKKLGLK